MTFETTERNKQFFQEQHVSQTSLDMPRLQCQGLYWVITTCESCITPLKVEHIIIHCRKLLGGRERHKTHSGHPERVKSNQTLLG